MNQLSLERFRHPSAIDTLLFVAATSLLLSISSCSKTGPVIPLSNQIEESAVDEVVEIETLQAEWEGKFRASIEEFKASGNYPQLKSATLTDFNVQEYEKGYGFGNALLNSLREYDESNKDSGIIVEYTDYRFTVIFNGIDEEDLPEEISAGILIFRKDSRFESKPGEKNVRYQCIYTFKTME